MNGVKIFVFCLVAVMLSGVCSALCTESDQVIMRLASSGNTHGALWNETSYGVRICYDNYFGAAYEGSSAHECKDDDTNLVLRLYATINSHAAAGNFLGYPIKVCHGGLKSCLIREGDCRTSSGEATLAYLANLNNSHISKRPSLGYNYSICCKGETAPVSPTWDDPTACYQLNYSQSACEGAEGRVAVQTDPSPGCMVHNDNCHCEWNSTASAELKCRAIWESALGEPGCDYKCVVETREQTACTGGSQILSLNARMISGNSSCVMIQDPDCRSGSATIGCGTMEANLPFFGQWQFLICLLSIALIYVIFDKNSYS